MHCHKCGKYMSYDDNFCSKCGTERKSYYTPDIPDIPNTTEDSGTIVDCARCSGTGTYTSPFWGTFSLCTVCGGKGKVRV